MEIITKQDAIARGLNYYFTGKPCIKGHIAKRLISSPHCMECKRNKRKKYYADNIDEQRAKGRKNHHDNREQRLKAMLEWQRNVIIKRQFMHVTILGAQLTKIK